MAYVAHVVRPSSRTILCSTIDTHLRCLDDKFRAFIVHRTLVVVVKWCLCCEWNGQNLINTSSITVGHHLFSAVGCWSQKEDLHKFDRKNYIHAQHTYLQVYTYSAPHTHTLGWMLSQSDSRFVFTSSHLAYGQFELFKRRIVPTQSVGRGFTLANPSARAHHCKLSALCGLEFQSDSFKCNELRSLLL